MLQYALSLRLIMLIGSIGAMFGALLMFRQGGTRIVVALRALVAANEPMLVAGSIKSALDAPPTLLARADEVIE
jgi:hypothetical protein